MSSNGKLGTSARSLLICLFKCEKNYVLGFFFFYTMSSENVTMHE